MADLTEITDALIAGDNDTVLNLVQKTLNDGTAAKQILNDGLIKGMDIVGEKMEDGDMFIPEVLRCAKIMSAAVELLKPHLAEKEMAASGKVVFGTVKGDLHDIGKNLVIMMLKSAGFDVVDLGVNVSPETFVDAAKQNGANIVALSALLTTTMDMMHKTLDVIKQSDLADNVRVMVGGAPVSQKFANEIGAHGYAPDAGAAIKLAKSLVQR